MFPSDIFPSDMFSSVYQGMGELSKSGANPYALAATLGSDVCIMFSSYIHTHAHTRTHARARAQHKEQSTHNIH